MSDEFEIGLELFDELYKEAEEIYESATSFSNVGKFHSYTTAHIWLEDTREMKEVSVNEWRAHQGFKFLQLHVEVDTPEFNANLEKPYERRVQIKGAPWNRKNADGTYTRVPSDWEAIFEPALLEATGKGSVSEALKAVEGKYVKVLDVKQQPTKRSPDPEYNTAKIVKVYSSREEAYDEYTSTKPATTGQVVLSDEVVSSVKMLAGLNKTPAEIVKSLGVNGLTEEKVNLILGA